MQRLKIGSIKSSVKNSITFLRANTEDGLDHGGDLVLADGAEGLQALRGKQLQVADLTDLDIVGTVVSPDEISPVSAESCR